MTDGEKIFQAIKERDRELIKAVGGGEKVVKEARGLITMILDNSKQIVYYEDRHELHSMLLRWASHLSINGEDWPDIDIDREDRKPDKLITRPPKKISNTDIFKKIIKRFVGGQMRMQSLYGSGFTSRIEKIEIKDEIFIIELAESKDGPRTHSGIIHKTKIILLVNGNIALEGMEFGDRCILLMKKD